MADVLKRLKTHTFVFIFVFLIYKKKVIWDICMQDMIHVTLAIVLHILNVIAIYFAEKRIFILRCIRCIWNVYKILIYDVTAVQITAGYIKLVYISFNIVVIALNMCSLIKLNIYLNKIKSVSFLSVVDYVIQK